MKSSLRLIGLVIALTLLAAAPAAATKGKHWHKPKPRTVDVQLIGLNDFHGHLESTTPGMISPTGGATDRVPAGGAEYLPTHIRGLERQNRNTLVVSAGDLIGASPLLSALFHDEPTIEAMNRIGLDLNAVGNHEFDEGAASSGACSAAAATRPTAARTGPASAAPTSSSWPRTWRTSARAGRSSPPYKIKRFKGVKVGFIGMTLEGTPDIVSPSGVAGLDFLDEADTANRYARELERRHGVDAIVVLLHEGGAQTPPIAINGCAGMAGPIVDIVNRTTDEVDLFITGHTHNAYNCVIDGRPVTSASSFGRLITEIDLELDRRSGEIVEVAANNRIVTQSVMKAPDMTELIARYNTLAAPLRDRVIGRSRRRRDPHGRRLGRERGRQPDRRRAARRDRRRGHRPGRRRVHEPGRRARRPRRRARSPTARRSPSSRSATRS